MKVRFETVGLATTMHTNCTMRSKRFGGHKTKCGEDIIIEKKEARYKCNSRYAINQKMIISHHLCGLGYYETRKIFAFLDLPYMNFRAFKRCEEFVGKNGLEKVTKKVIKNALQEEIQLTNEVYETDKYKKLPALTVSLDMVWQKRSSGRRYNSPSGVIHCIGARSGKIIFSFFYRNHCNYCMKLGFLL